MSALGTTVPTLVDIAKLWDPNGSLAKVVELLSLSNQILMDMPYYEGNLPTGNVTTVRTGYPSVTWRLLNRGVDPSKGTTAQITEAFAMMESWSEVDEDLATLNGNLAAYRLSQAKGHIEAMNQELASVLWYGNSGLDPEKFTGFSPRFSSLSAGNAQNIIDGGGVGSDNTSVWLIGWGEETVHGGYPKGSTAGLVHNDLGLQTVQTSTGIGTGRMRAYQEQFKWKSGLVIKDWRYVVRLCNIDVSNLVAESTAVDLTNKMIRMRVRLGVNGNGQDVARAVFYMNRTVFEMLAIQRRADVRTGGQLNYDVVDGRLTPSFMGIPIRVSDSLLNTEARVT